MDPAPRGALIGLLLVTSCKSLEIDPGLMAEGATRNSDRLPNLEVLIDPTVEYCFPRDSIYAAFVQFTARPLTMERDQLVRWEVEHEHPRMHDLISRFLRADVGQNVCSDQPASPVGFLKCRVLRATSMMNGAWIGLAFGTLGLSALCGLPAESRVSTMTVEVEVLDLERNVLGSYTAEGEGAAYMALWWGYETGSMQEAQLEIGTFPPPPREMAYPEAPFDSVFINAPLARVAYMNALQDAMETIKGEIAADLERLRAGLGSREKGSLPGSGS